MDGESENRSWNCGVEGPTDDEAVNRLRNQQKRNFLTTLLLSQGVPMIVAGDELSRTQGGNNNAYCQDNEISWLDWENADTDLLQFTRKLIALRKSHPVFTRRRWFKGQVIPGMKVEDIGWFLPEGARMHSEHWNQDFAKSLAIFINGLAIRGQDARGVPIIDDNFYLMFNAWHEALDFKLPPAKYGSKWLKILDTYTGELYDNLSSHAARDTIRVEGRSILVFKHRNRPRVKPVSKLPVEGI